MHELSTLSVPTSPATLAATHTTTTTATAMSHYSRHRPGYELRVSEALRVLRDAAEGHPGTAVFTTSLGVEDMVITDLVAKHHLRIELVTLDTGKLHLQTLALVPLVNVRYGLTVRSVRPVEVEVVHFVGTHGEQAMRTSVELRKACCGIRKVEPLQRALAGKTAWVTGMRREQSSNRADVPLMSFEAATGRTKYSPLAGWSWADVWRYVELNDVPYNALHDQFFPSIGCEPCTRAVSLGEDIRSGRWWWETEAVKECGLHSHETAVDVPLDIAVDIALDTPPVIHTDIHTEDKP